MTFPLKFRQHVLAIGKKEHLTFAQTAERFGVGIASVMRWAKNPQPKTTRHKTPSKIHAEALLQDVAEYPDAFQYERAERPGCSARGISDALRRLGMTRKHGWLPATAVKQHDFICFKALFFPYQKIPWQPKNEEKYPRFR